MSTRVYTTPRANIICIYYRTNAADTSRRKIEPFLPADARVRISRRTRTVFPKNQNVLRLYFPKINIPDETDFPKQIFPLPPLPLKKKPSRSRFSKKNLRAECFHLVRRYFTSNRQRSSRRLLGAGFRNVKALGPSLVVTPFFNCMYLILVHYKCALDV